MNDDKKKIYFIYANFPTKIFKKFMYDPQNACALDICTSKRFTYDSEYDTWRGLYAITIDKKLYKRFIDIHNHKYFKCVKRKMTLNEYQEFSKADNRRYELQEEKLNTELSNSIELVLVRHERDLIDSYIDEKAAELGERAYDNEIHFPDYIIFKKKYQDALETLYYTTFFTCFWSTNAEDVDDDTGINEEVEIAMEGMSYGLTYPSGRGIAYDPNGFEIYVRVFNPILSL